MKTGRLARFSRIHSRANEPFWTSSSIRFISAFVSALMTRGPRVRSPYCAVLLTEYRIVEIPPS